jgi:hypothetical protein
MPPLAGRYALPYSISEARPATQTSEFDRPGKQVLVLGQPWLMGQMRRLLQEAAGGRDCVALQYVAKGREPT